MKKEKELLRKQLALLAEQSKASLNIDLSSLSNSMVRIYRTLVLEHALFISLLIMDANLFIGILVHVKKLFGRHSR